MPGSDRDSVRLRVERPADLAAIAEVALRAFGGQGEATAGLVGSLRRSPAWDPDLSFVAETTGEPPRVVGHALATHNLLDAPRRLVDVLVIGPVGVLPGFQRRGIGSALMRHALEVIAAGPAPMVFLEGDPSYYSRFGFEAAGPKGFRRPSLRIPEPAFMVKLLPSYEPWMTGTLVYADPFWRHDRVGLRDAGA